MLTVPQAARRVGRNPETIRRWIRAGRLPARKVGTQHVIEEQDLAAPGRLAGHELVAPRLLWSEVPSVLHELQWRAAVSPALASRALERFLAAGISPRSPRRLAAETWQVADELGWAKTYDAAYVALARLLSCRLLTIDARLRRGARRAVDIVGPTEL
jgi:excisionase family DNA binding protein